MYVRQYSPESYPWTIFLVEKYDELTKTQWEYQKKEKKTFPFPSKSKSKKK